MYFSMMEPCFRIKLLILSANNKKLREYQINYLHFFVNDYEKDIIPCQTYFHSTTENHSHRIKRNRDYVSFTSP